MFKSRGRYLFGSFLLVVLSAPASAAGLLFHDGFETCWVTAQTKPQFLASIRTSIDGTSACIPPQSGSQSGVDYTACNNANGCGSGVPGCAVTIQSGPFAGDFVSGQFTAPGTASNITVPITTSVFGSCNANITAITLNYALDYLLQIDGIDGVYTDDLLPPVVDITNYSASNNCNPVIAALINSYIAQAIVSAEASASAAIEPDLRADTLDESICPLTP